MDVSPTDLRSLAERRLHSSTDASASTPDSRLTYELEIHREELEIQNEELRRVHLELKASRDHYADLYDFAPIGYLTLNRYGIIAEANLTACSLLGRERSRLIGIRLSTICNDHCKSALARHFGETLETGARASCEIEFATDRRLYLRLETVRANSDDSSEGYILRTALTDISDRKLAERLAVERQRHLHSLADALPILISYLDAKLTIRFSNAAHREWFGVSPEELYGRTLHDALGNLNEDIYRHLEVASSGCEVRVEATVNHARLGLRNVNLMLVPDAEKAGVVQGIHFMCVDISEHKIIEQQHARRRLLDAKLERFSDDERIVYDLIIRGLTNKLIALELDIGTRTVERRRRAIFDKLEVDSIAELFHLLSSASGLETPS